MTDDAVAQTSKPELEFRPFRALLPQANGERLARLLSPPYDVVNDAARTALLEDEPDNAIGLVLPQDPDGGDPYDYAAHRLEDLTSRGVYRLNPSPAIYVYEMVSPEGTATRGLIGAVGLRDPADGVILPHENTMAGPVADRLALMTATEANLEPIYLVYDGAGAAARAVRDVVDDEALADTTTADGVRHRLWVITESADILQITADLRIRTAVIADGHHRYATYRELQRRVGAERGAGPWDFGLTLLVNSSDYGPQVHAIHRVLPQMSFDRAVERLDGWAAVHEVANGIEGTEGLATIRDAPEFAVVLTDGKRTVVVSDDAGRIAEAARATLTDGEPAVLAELDIVALHRVVIAQIWGVDDTVENVGYAHSVTDALAAATAGQGCAVLVRPTPVQAVAAVAAAGGRMPRKSTLFTPKPATGLVMRRFADER